MALLDEKGQLTPAAKTEEQVLDKPMLGISPNVDQSGEMKIKPTAFTVNPPKGYVWLGISMINGDVDDLKDMLIRQLRRRGAKIVPGTLWVSVKCLADETKWLPKKRKK